MTPDLASTLVGLVIGLVIGGLAFGYWKLRYTREIRRDALIRSRAVIGGMVHEQLVPHLPGFEFDPRDARFLGAPVDYVVFDGLAAGTVRRVVFLEVKTGGARVSPREQQVREAIRAGQVEWREWRVGPPAPRD